MNGWVKGFTILGNTHFSFLKLPNWLWGPSKRFSEYRWLFFVRIRPKCALNNSSRKSFEFNPLNAELNPICHLLTLLGAHHILHVSRIRVKPLNAELNPICHLLALLGAHLIFQMSSIRVKNEGSYTSTPFISLHGLSRDTLNLISSPNVYATFSELQTTSLNKNDRQSKSSRKCGIAL